MKNLLLVMFPFLLLSFTNKGVEWSVKITASSTRQCVELRKQPLYFSDKEWLSDGTKVMLLRQSRKMVEMKIVDARFLNSYEIGYVYFSSVEIPSDILSKVPKIETFNPCQSWHSDDF